MKSGSDALAAIKKRQRRGERPVFFFDFDGTLAPVVNYAAKAKMSAHTAALVERLARLHSVYIVTGRSLSDIEKRARIPRVRYAGNHGMTWSAGRKKRGARLSKAALNDVAEAERSLCVLTKVRGAYIEEKGISFALHYRNVSSHATPRLLAAARRALATILERRNIELLHQKKALDIRPKGWHKGDYVRMVMEQAPKKSFAVYVGDDTTDEDAFRAIKNGFSIRVGKSPKSGARYFLPTRERIDVFLARLCAADVDDRKLKR